MDPRELAGVLGKTKIEGWSGCRASERFYEGEDICGGGAAKAGGITGVQCESDVQRETRYYSGFCRCGCHQYHSLEKHADHFHQKAWQIDSHQGFIKAFMSSIRHGPIHNQHSDWRKIGERLTLQKAVGDEDSGAAGLQNGKVLIILGEKDPIIIVEEMVEDATQVLGLENVRFEICDAGHELPITESAKVVDLIWSFWEMRKGADPGPSE